MTDRAASPRWAMHFAGVLPFTDKNYEASLGASSLGVCRALNNALYGAWIHQERHEFSQRVVGKRLNFKQKHGRSCRLTIIFLTVLPVTGDATAKRAWCVNALY